MVYDSNKQFMAARDMFPESVTLGEGEYTLRLELRHTDRDALEAWESLLVAVDRNHFRFAAIPAIDRDRQKLLLHDDRWMMRDDVKDHGVPSRLMLGRHKHGPFGHVLPAADLHPDTDDNT